MAKRVYLFNEGGNLSVAEHMKVGNMRTNNNNKGWVMPYDSTLTDISYGGDNNNSSTLELLADGVQIAAFSVGGMNTVTNGLSLAISSGAKLSARNDSGGDMLKDVTFNLMFERD